MLIWWCCTFTCVYYYYFIFEANVSAILAFSYSLQFTNVLLLYCYIHCAVTVSWNKLLLSINYSLPSSRTVEGHLWCSRKVRISWYIEDHHTITGSYMPPSSSEFPAFISSKAGTRFSDPGVMQGWVHLGGSFIPRQSLILEIAGQCHDWESNLWLQVWHSNQ